MNTEQLVRDALEQGVSGVPCPEPDVEALVTAGRVLRIRRAGLAAAVAAAVVLVLVGVSVAWTGARRSADEPVPAGPSVTRARVETRLSTDPPFLIRGWVQRGRVVLDTDAHVAQLTPLLSGFVWVEDETADPRIVFTGWDGGTKVIARNPWPSVEPMAETTDHPRPQRRNVVGNPERNWFAWVAPGEGGNRIVVGHPTGGARTTTIPDAGGPEWLDILSVDAGTVYLRRCPAPSEPLENPGGDLATGPTSRAGCSIWVWTWQESTRVVPTGHSWVEPDGSVVEDVTSQVWAVARPGRRGLTFVSPQGGHLSEADVVVSGGNEGNGLSPDGRFWFSRGSRSVVVTASGEIRSLRAELSRVGVGDGLRFVWVEPTTVMVVDDDTMTTCDASTATCAEPSDVGTLLTNAILPVQ